MWQAVRRELVRLEWDVEPPLTLDLMADATPEEQRHYLQMASLSARHLANILNDILGSDHCPVSIDIDL